MNDKVKRQRTYGAVIPAPTLPQHRPASPDAALGPATRHKQAACGRGGRRVESAATGLCWKTHRGAAAFLSGCHRIASLRYARLMSMLQASRGTPKMTYGSVTSPVNGSPLLIAH
eukprot:COSAG01_NODE_20266_length_962_cov_2.502897_1_plen_115_part_00